MNRYGQLVGFTLAAAAIFGTMAACSGTDPGNAAGSGATQAAPENAEKEKDAAAAARRRAGREPGAIRLGDLNKPKTPAEVGAPYDVCSLAWTDVPVEVRPTDGKPHQPTLDAPKKDDPFLVRCRYDNSGEIAINGGGAGYFILGVGWGDQIETDPAKISGSTAKSWNGKAGLIQRLPDKPQKGKSCIGSVKLSKGAAMVDVTNGRFPNIDPCTVVDAALAVVAAKGS